MGKQTECAVFASSNNLMQLKLVQCDLKAINFFENGKNAEKKLMAEPLEKGLKWSIPNECDTKYWTQ